jgi:hypothetical protein
VRRLGLTAGIGGLVLGTLWGGWLFLLPPDFFPGIRFGLGVAALLLILVGLLAGRREVAQALRGRRMQIGLHSLVFVLVVLAGYLLVNFAAARNRFLWDLTDMKQWSLSETSRQVLAGLDEDIRIIGFFGSEQKREERNARDMYRLYEEASPRVSWTIVDPLKEPALRERYGVAAAGTTVVACGERFRWGHGASQTTLTNLIAAVSGGERRALFLAGRGMRSPEDRRREGYQEMKSMLRESLYEVSSAVLTPGESLDPRETTVVILAGPREPLEDFETQILDDYLRAGGKVLALVDPVVAGESSPVSALTTRWGLDLQPGVVAQENQAATPWLVFARRFGVNPEVRKLARSLEGRRVAFDRPGYIDVVETEDIRLYRDSLVAVRPEEDRVFLTSGTYPGRPDPERDLLPMPPETDLSLVAFAWREVLREGRTVAISRLALVADADLGDNYTLLQYDNRILVSGLVGWLTEEVLVVEEASGGTKVEVAWLDHWRALATVMVLPALLVALLGTGILLYRRWR